MESLLQLAAVLALVAINGVLVAAEFALVSARPTRIDQLVAQGNRRARTVQRAMADPNRFISAAQVGITMSSLGLGWIAEPALAKLLVPIFEPILGERSFIGAHLIAGILAYLLITLLHIVLGEQVPKMIALQRSEATILATASPVTWLAIPFRPLIALLYWLTGIVLRVLNLEQHKEHHLVYSADELKMMVSASQEQGLLEKSEEQLIQRVLGFSDVVAEEVMVPRTEMTAISIVATMDEVTRTVADSGHARIPVYGEGPDDILGIFYAKDLYKVIAAGQERTFSLKRLIRTPMSVTASMPIDDLLARMKRERTQIAIVIDEYGGTAGLVTLEDVVERIIGQLDDEFEPPSVEIEELPDGTIRVSGLASIDEVSERFHLGISEPFYNTVGGYVFGQLGRRPEVGDEVVANGRTMRVDALDGLRIDRVILSAAPSEAPSRDRLLDAIDQGEDLAP